eukprot:TRINITY_DN10303_c0_g1_i2.p1 TRINITY_DN10303_c0_g1~~TRINITY_DN10303_c0_g1_i2.p1  ORF type:complete len:146 (+),score=39.36 TRINITY_DN10303_c0_g1_i2:30-467(+)
MFCLVDITSVFFFFFQAEDGIRDAQESRGLGDVYKRQGLGLGPELVFRLGEGEGEGEGKVLLFTLGAGVVPRVVLFAEPVNNGEVVPKSVPDFESCGAVWLTVDEIGSLGSEQFRGDYTAELIQMVEAQGPVSYTHLTLPTKRIV